MCTLDVLTRTDTADTGREFVEWAEEKLGMSVFGYFGFSEDRTSLIFTAIDRKDGGKEIGYFKLTDWPGSPFLFSSDLFVHEEYRGKGFAQKFMEMKIEICRRINDYGILCLIWAGNKSQKHILEKTGWKKVCDLPGQIEQWFRPVA